MLTEAVLVPVRFQDTPYSCGAAALQAALAAVGLDYPEAALARALGTDPRDGTRPAEITGLLDRLGVPYEARDGLDVDDLAHATAQGLPVLCCVQMHGGGHWVVVTDVGPPAARTKQISFMDPASGGGNRQTSEIHWVRRWKDTDADGRPFGRFGIAIGKPAEGHEPPPLHESRLFEDLGTRAVEPLAPADAIRWLLSLVPTLTPPEGFEGAVRRQAFALAASTSLELTQRIQQAVADLLAQGATAAQGGEALDAVLDAAGVGPRQKGYSENVWRTNAMQAFNGGLEDELRQAEDSFPAWKYSNPDDSRSRPTHAERNGNYYPSSVPFSQVRGTDAADVCQCRCVPIPVFVLDWKRLRAEGARFADGYESGD